SRQTSPNSVAATSANDNAWNSAMRNVVVRRKLVRRTQAIADATNRVQRGERETAVELRPKAADMRFDKTRSGVEVELPNLLEQHRACHHAAGVGHQVFEQAEFTRLQVETLPGTTGLAADAVEFEVGDAQHRESLRERLPACEGADACLQFDKREG